jgi:hypothetical protein
MLLLSRNRSRFDLDRSVLTLYVAAHFGWWNCNGDLRASYQSEWYSHLKWRRDTVVLVAMLHKWSCLKGEPFCLFQLSDWPSAWTVRPPNKPTVHPDFHSCRQSFAAGPMGTVVSVSTIILNYYPFSSYDVMFAVRVFDFFDKLTQYPSRLFSYFWRHSLIILKFKSCILARDAPFCIREGKFRWRWPSCGL